jgi:methyl-CpG-binding domain protein 4
MVNYRDPDSRRGLDLHEHLSLKHMVPIPCKSRVGRAGHHVAQMEPLDRADRDHRDLSTTRDPEHLVMTQPLRDDLMVQQQLPAKVEWIRRWQHMVAVIMLNQTGRKPVKTVFPIFINRWPTPLQFGQATEQEIKEVIWPLGMVNVRCKRLVRMTEDFLTWDGEDATMLYGIGKYGSDSYEIFFRQNYSVEPTDKELVRYLREEIFVTV